MVTMSRLMNFLYKFLSSYIMYSQGMYSIVCLNFCSLLIFWEEIIREIVDETTIVATLILLLSFFKKKKIFGNVVELHNMFIIFK